MIPSYLINIAHQLDSDESESCIGIRCTCGCDEFAIYKNKKSAEVKRLEEEHYTNMLEISFAGIQVADDGKMYRVKRNIFGKVIKKVPLAPDTKYIVKRNIFGKVVKRIPIFQEHFPIFKYFVGAKCCNCGKEYVLFDGRQHGYCACSSTVSIEKPFYDDQKQKIEITVYYDDEDLNDTDIKDKSIAFDRIVIHSISNGKKNKIIDVEC